MSAPTHVISIANQKGGVGKTTTAIHLAVALARRKIPTLLLDLDPQGNATSGLGFPRSEGHGLYGPLLEGSDPSGQCLPTREAHLHLLPSEVDLAALEVELAKMPDYLLRLRRTLQPILESQKYRVVCIDCPPALGLLSMNALCCAHSLLLAQQCEYFALEGLSQILKVLEALKSSGANPHLGILGIVMTLCDPRTRLSRQVLQDIQTHFPQLVFKTHIPRSVRLSEASSFGQSIFEYDPKNPGALAYKALAQEAWQRIQNWQAPGTPG